MNITELTVHELQEKIKNKELTITEINEAYVKQIKENINFIKSKSLSFPNIEICLHVLSEESYELKKTYDYVFKNYGL